MPDGVDEVIDSLESAGVVLDASNNVIKASTGALAFGLVWNQALVHEQVVALVDQVRRDGVPVSQELNLTRGPFGEAQLHLLVRVARLGTAVRPRCWPTTAPRRTASTTCAATSSPTSATS